MNREKKNPRKPRATTKRTLKSLADNVRGRDFIFALEPVVDAAQESVPSGRLPLFIERLRPTTIKRPWKPEHFYSDKSRIVFCSSFRRMMRKAQVFSLESNTSVRNRLTHSLEVADIGRTLTRLVGKKLETAGYSNPEDTECMQSIVESACLIHDIGNPPFGHFGEDAIKKWFRERGMEIFHRVCKQLQLKISHDAILTDFLMFDGNPQTFRIVTRLHTDVDQFGLNLTDSTLLSSVKYPHAASIPKNGMFNKKMGIFSSEKAIYNQICQRCGIKPGQRYFLAYLVELADDICYCLSDITDSFEKRITNSRDFKEEFRTICINQGVDIESVVPRKMEKIKHFGYDVAIRVSRLIMDEASDYFTNNIEKFLSGTAGELAGELTSGKILECLKIFARKFIYTDHEVQRIEIAGSRIVDGLLTHFGKLLELSRLDFTHFVEKGEQRRGSGLDTEWRIYNQLSTRMVSVYKNVTQTCSDEEEWLSRARLVVDYISGLTDDSALRMYQNFMGISL